MADRYEIAFSFDTTGSMFGYLEEVQSQLREMVQDLKRDIPGIRIAIFAHGDYCDAGKTYITKHVDFTNDADRLCPFVRDVGATFGGDEPECYELVMREVQEKLSWSPRSQKSLVIIGDAPPHEASESQNYRHIDWRQETRSLRNMVHNRYFLAHQTRFSAIFSSADKIYLTYPYPTRGIDKKRITTRVVNTLVV